MLAGLGDLYVQALGLFVVDSVWIAPGLQGADTTVGECLHWQALWSVCVGSASGSAGVHGFSNTELDQPRLRATIIIQ